MLASFDHPALLKVYQFWEGNGTAYMVMPLYEGSTLKQVLQSHDAQANDVGPTTEAWLKGLLGPLLDALGYLHAARCYHRDISPDNILIQNDGCPLLLDFGAARRVISDMTHTLTVILKPGYAPIEQYGALPGSQQGPWTDIYALAAVLYRAVTGKVPTPSITRIVSDALEPASRVAAGRYSPAFLAGIDQALSVRPEGRPQNVGELRALWGLDGTTKRAREPASTRAVARHHLWAIGAVATLTFLAALASIRYFSVPFTPPPSSSEQTQPVTTTPPAALPRTTPEPDIAAPLESTKRATATAPPAPSPAPARAVRHKPAAHPSAAAAVRPQAPASNQGPPSEVCTELLQRASLGDLSAAERATLTNSCK